MQEYIFVVLMATFNALGIKYVADGFFRKGSLGAFLFILIVIVTQITIMPERFQ